MIAPEALCVCGDPSAGHRMGRKGCKEPDCGCDRFEPTGQFVPEQLPRLSAVPDRVDQADPAGPPLGDGGTVAAGQVVTAAGLTPLPPGAEALSLLTQISDMLSHAGERSTDALDTLVDDVQAYIALHNLVAEQRDRASEALVTARTELEQHRDQLAAVRVAAAKKVRAALDASARLAEQVIAEHVRYLCETCGSRYGFNHQHEHGPLTPVTVTTARIGAPAT